MTGLTFQIQSLKFENNWLDGTKKIDYELKFIMKYEEY